jgi:hypothetical protein
MNWPLWMLPIVLPITLAKAVGAWVKGRVIEGNRHWNGYDPWNPPPYADCPCRACKRARG